MSTIDFEVEGLADLEAKLKKIASTFPQEQEKQLQKLGNLLSAEIQLVTPVGDTGDLRRSITSLPIDANNIEVGTDIEYGEWVNDGHVAGNSFVEGQHFMENGMQEAEPKVLADVTSWMEKMLEGLGN